MSGLVPLMPRDEAERMAEAIAALIDGLYIRRALRDGLPNPTSASGLVEDYVDAKLAQQANAR
jgi:TetR/AcrR family transcriptional repressor of bet genes